MTEQDLKIAAAKRPIGKKGAREVESSQVRGVVYGKHLASMPVITDYNALYAIFSKAGGNQIVTLAVEGEEEHDVLFKDIDYNPVTNRIRHFDLYAVTKGEKITVEVPVVLTGDAPAEKAGFLVSVFVESVEVSTIPRKIPESIVISRESLVEVGDTITMSFANIDDNDIEILSEAETVVAKVEEIQELVVEDEGPTEMPADEEGEDSSDEGGKDAKADSKES